MAAVKQDLQVEQGATYKKVVRFLDQNKNPIAIDDAWIFRGQARKSPEDTLKAFDFTLTKLNSTDLEIKILPSVTSALTLTNYPKNNVGKYTLCYDIEVEYGADDIDRLYEGKVFISPESTK